MFDLSIFKVVPSLSHKADFYYAFPKVSKLVVLCIICCNFDCLKFKKNSRSRNTLSCTSGEKIMYEILSLKSLSIGVAFVGDLPSDEGHIDTTE